MLMSLEPFSYVTIKAGEMVRLDYMGVHIIILGPDIGVLADVCFEWSTVLYV